MYRCLTLYEHLSFVLSEKCVQGPIPHNQYWPINNYYIPQRCCTNYIQGLPNDAKELYEQYTQLFEGDPFGTDTLECGNILTNSIMKGRQKKWRELIESIDMTQEQ